MQNSEQEHRTRESTIEGYFCRQVKKLGGKVYKMVWPGIKGAPDRMVAYHGSHFVELKRPGKKAEAHQKRRHADLEKQGIHVAVISTKEEVDLWINLLVKNSKRKTTNTPL